MAGSRIVRLVLALTLTFVLAGLAAPPSFAQTCAPDAVLCLPAGTACAGFDLQVQASGGEHYVSKQFYNKNGDLLRLLGAGKGVELTFTNLSSGGTLKTPANGSVSHVTPNPNGSSTLVTTGHFLIIFFPTDVPAGPSTKIYIGQAVVAIDAYGNYTLLKASGQSTDICAALSG
jgi:hypothetical protein